MNIQTLKMDVVTLNAFLQREFPQWNSETGSQVTDVTTDGVICRLPFNDSQLRPGGTVSGPTMMGLADSAMYAAVLSRIGPVALAVTTNLNINFMRKPEPRATIATCRLLKLGKRLAIGDVSIVSEGDTDLVAHATVTYSIPPRG